MNIAHLPSGTQPATGKPQRQVLCFGEALIDFLHIGAEQQGPLQLPAYRQFPGGAPANAAVAVAKLGGNARFAGQVGQDAFGDFLAQALQAYGVDLSLLKRHPTAKTALAFVMLDDTGDRSFSFYRDQSADVLFAAEQIGTDWFESKPILHICSNTLTDDFIANTTRLLVQQAKAAGCLVSFDVNLRHNLWQEGAANRERVNALVWQADIVKFSRDELQYLSKEEAGADQAAAEQAYLARCLQAGCQLLLITDGGGNIDYYRAGSAPVTVTPPKVAVVDTTAGGDAFIGGLLFSLSCLAETTLPDGALLAACIEFATACGAVTVTRPGAFPALPDAAEILADLAKRAVDVQALLPFLPVAPAC
jgi:fructokinase